MSLEPGELVYTLDNEGGCYYAFAQELSEPPSHCRLIFSNGSVQWVPVEQIGRMQFGAEVEDLERETPAPPPGEDGMHPIALTTPQEWLHTAQPQTASRRKRLSVRIKPRRPRKPSWFCCCQPYESI